MDDAISYRAKNPGYRHREVPWSDEQSARLVEIWRLLLESQNGEGVDGSEVPDAGGAIGWALREFVSPGKRVLILGAGRGQEVSFAHGHDYDAVGFTLGALNIEIGREALGLDLQFRDAHCSLLPSGSFDALIGFEVVEHSPAPLILLLECARVLRPDGVAVFSTPPPMYHTGGRSLHHVLCPTPRQFTGLLEKSGFLDVRHFCVSNQIAEVDIDRGDIRLLRTVARRASDAELEGFDPMTRRIVRGHTS